MHTYFEKLKSKDQWKGGEGKRVLEVGVEVF